MRIETDIEWCRRAIIVLGADAYVNAIWATREIEYVLRHGAPSPRWSWPILKSQEPKVLAIKRVKTSTKDR